ncbi:MAG: NIPSNAP family protein [Hyphomicrobium sp.]|nr:NIPSNAP family protein [Hyphomicrobium sp.]
MSIYQHHVLAIPPKQHAAIAEGIKSAGATVIADKGGRLFGIWKPLLGLSLNHLIVLTEWPDADAAIAHGADILHGIEGATIELCDLWQPTLRPAPGSRLPELSGGYYSHRHYDIAADTLETFLEHSGAA